MSFVEKHLGEDNVLRLFLFSLLLKKYLFGSYHLLSTVDAMVTKIGMIPALYHMRGKQIVMQLNIKLLMRKQQ